MLTRTSTSRSPRLKSASNESSQEHREREFGTDLVILTQTMSSSFIFSFLDCTKRLVSFSPSPSAYTHSLGLKFLSQTTHLLDLRMVLLSFHSISNSLSNLLSFHHRFIVPSPSFPCQSFPKDSSSESILQSSYTHVRSDRKIN